jgi:hypothetical protein
MKKILTLLFILFSIVAYSQSTSITWQDTTLRYKHINPATGLAVRDSVSIPTKWMVRNDTAFWRLGKVWVYAFPLVAGGGNITVDSVSNNGAGDSLVVIYTDGTRRAYVYPAGSSSNWVNDGSAVRINNNVLIGGAYTPAARLQGVLANDATPLTVSSWDTRHAVFGATSSTGGGLAISRTSSTATTNILAVQPGVAWENIILNANTFKFMTTGTVQGLSQDVNGQVSVGAGTVYSGFQHNTGIGYKYNAQAGNYTLLGSDIIVEYAAAGTHTYTLPSSAGITGRTYKIINSGATALTVATTSSQIFYNVTGTPTSLTLPAKSGIEVSSNGAGWVVDADYNYASGGGKQGADVASAAGAITLGSDGNVFEITGTNSITAIVNTSWQNGATITLLFTSTATLTDGTANSGTSIGFELAGNANFTASADDVITLVLSEIGGTQRWREVSRSVN